MFAYCGNDPVNNCDSNGKWYRGLSDDIIEEFMISQGSENYSAYDDLHDKPGYISDEDFAALKDEVSNDNILGYASDAASGVLTFSGLINVGKELGDNCICSGVFSVLSLPTTLSAQLGDPRLSPGGKLALSGYDLAVCASSFLLAAVIVINPLGLTAAVASIVGTIAPFVYTATTTAFGNEMQEALEDHEWDDYL